MVLCRPVNYILCLDSFLYFITRNEIDTAIRVRVVIAEFERRDSIVGADGHVSINSFQIREVINVRLWRFACAHPKVHDFTYFNLKICSACFLDIFGGVLGCVCIHFDI